MSKWRFVEADRDAGTWYAQMNGQEDLGLHYDEPTPGSTITLGDPSPFKVEITDIDIV